MSVARRMPSFVVALLALCAVLLAALAALWLADGGWQPPPAQPPQLDDLAAAAPHIDAPTQNVPAVLLEQPPFHVSRRPPPAAPEKEAEPAPAIALDKARFYGIVSGPALVTVMAEIEGQPQSLRMGDHVGEWELQAIHGREITFRKGDERHVIELPHAHMAGAPAAEQGKSKDPGGSAARPPLPPRSALR